ncbi:S8 family peptidase [Saccharopolyspora erythraea]|uniref:S8 family peptidase n=1 Tax=Saccharopolyspora erythraea TaxID=1836 RepID=UPI002012F266|nr:S8 family peptidase [Saccharopolyspora erythraea]
MRAGRSRFTALCLGAVATTVLAAGTATASQDTLGEIRNAGQAGTVAGQYIVALTGPASPSATAEAAVSAQAQGLADRYGATVRDVYSASFRGFAVNATEQQARRMAADPHVRYVEADGIAHVAGTQQNPPSWGLDRIDGRRDSAYTYPNDGAGATAYVLDTGVDLRHTSFEGRARSGHDFIDNDSDASDCQGHGTHVAGTIASREYGVAKKADIVSVRVLNCQGSGQWSQVIGGIDWVAQNAEAPAVANMSLGGGASQSVDDAVRGAIRAGVSFALAAGNDNRDACNTSPARVAEAITVGSTDSSDRRSSFSNYGRCLDLFAPGSNITSTRNGGGSTSMSGTSMATPHVAGAAAIHLAAHPSATPQQVRDALVRGGQQGVVTSPGSGSPNVLLNVTQLGR